MGCDIHAVVQVQRNGRWEDADFSVFDGRSYRLFGWLADVRNYSAVTPIREPKGLPEDFHHSEWEIWKDDAHSCSWFSAEELAAIDFDAMVEDRRVTRQVGPNCYDGSCTCDAGEGKAMTLREFLGDGYVSDIKKIVELGNSRVVFWFDN